MKTFLTKPNKTTAWMEFTSDRCLAPKEYICNGETEAQGEVSAVHQCPIASLR